MTVDLDALLREACATMETSERLQAAAIKEIKRLCEALEFYADEKNWTGSRAYTGCLMVPVDEDRGKIARAALHAEGGGDE